MKVRITIDYETEPPFRRTMKVEPKIVAGNETLVYGILSIARDLVLLRGVKAHLKDWHEEEESDITVVDAMGQPKPKLTKM